MRQRKCSMYQLRLWFFHLQLITQRVTLLIYMRILKGWKMVSSSGQLRNNTSIFLSAWSHLLISYEAPATAHFLACSSLGIIFWLQGHSVITKYIIFCTANVFCLHNLTPLLPRLTGQFQIIESKNS